MGGGCVAGTGGGEGEDGDGDGECDPCCAFGWNCCVEVRFVGVGTMTPGLLIEIFWSWMRWRLELDGGGMLRTEVLDLFTTSTVVALQ